MVKNDITPEDETVRKMYNKDMLPVEPERKTLTAAKKAKVS